MNKIFNIANLLWFTKTSFRVVFSLVVICLTVFLKIIAAMLEEDSSPSTSPKNHPYVLDENGKEIIDDHVTYVYDFDDQINLKGPL